LRLIFAGLIPGKTIWQLTPAKAGGNDAFVDYFMKMFLPDQNDIPRSNSRRSSQVLVKRQRAENAFGTRISCQSAGNQE
jgi:hypothetical protein